MKRMKYGIYLFIVFIASFCSNKQESQDIKVQQFALAQQSSHYLIRLDDSDDPVSLFEEGFGLIRMIPPEKLDGQSGWWLAYLTVEQADMLEADGVEIMAWDSVIISAMAEEGAEPLAPPDPCDSTPANDTFCPYDTTIPRCSRSILTEINNAPTDYPPVGGTTYVEVLNLGTTKGNKPIKGIRVGKIWMQSNPQIPQLIVFGGQHAREWAGTEMTMKLFRYYAEGYRDNKPGIRDLLSDKAIVFVPVANPDGYQYTHTGDRLWRKNRNPCSGGVGTDPNRNFPFTWGQPLSSTACTSDIYRGSEVGSEAETTAAQNLIANYGYTGQYKTGLVINMHAMGNYILMAEGISSSYSPCTTNSNCSPPDLGAFYKITGSERDIKMSDEETGAPYVVGPGFRMAYATGGDMVKDSVYGSLPGGSPHVMGVTPEITHTDCVFKAEELPHSQLSALFMNLKNFIQGPLSNIQAITDGTYWLANVGAFTLPHIHRRGTSSEYPVFRVSALNSLPSVSFGPPPGFSGTGSADNVLGGVAYNSWKWTPNKPYSFPHNMDVCTPTGCETAVFDHPGTGGFSLCDSAMFPTRNGWNYVGDSAGGPQNECYWKFTGSGSGPWRMTRWVSDLSNTNNNHLVYSYQWSSMSVVSAKVIVSSNNFVDCTNTGWGTCRIVRHFPYSDWDVYESRSSEFRTDIVDISDFDDMSIQVRFEVTVKSGTSPLLNIYDVQLAGWLD